jgi:hypothetical protein
LEGRGDDDILIAGSTVYDNDLAALDSIMAEWVSSRSYQERIDNLGGVTASGENGTFFLSDSTVFDDGDRDELTGGAGRDWFLLNADGDGNNPDCDVATDQRSNEVFTDIDIWL